jgi:hypothetical protein
MKVHIEVTEQDIKDGKPCTISSCPIARALRRTLPKSVAQVGGDGITMNGVFGRRSITTPAKILAFVESFDNGYPVKPFSFNIDV